MRIFLHSYLISHKMYNNIDSLFPYKNLTTHKYIIWKLGYTAVLEMLTHRKKYKKNARTFHPAPSKLPGWNHEYFIIYSTYYYHYYYYGIHGCHCNFPIRWGKHVILVLIFFVQRLRIQSVIMILFTDV